MLNAVSNGSQRPSETARRLRFALLLAALGAVFAIAVLSYAGYFSSAMVGRYIGGVIGALTIVISILALFAESTRAQLRRMLRDPLVVAGGAVGTVALVVAVALAGTSHDSAARDSAARDSAAQSTATATAGTPTTADIDESPSIAQTPNPYQGPATVVLDEPFTSPETTMDWREQDGRDQGCFFGSDGYHVATNSYYYECHGYRDFADFTVEAVLTMVRGNGGAVTFRDDNSGGQYYVIELDDTGAFTARKILKNRNIVLAEGKGGAGRTQTVAITAVGAKVTLYLGGKEVGHFSDAAITEGAIGFIAAGGKSSEIAVSRLRVWA